MIRREVAKLKYALIIFLSCLILFLAKRDSQVWRDIFKRKSLIYDENGFDSLKEELEGLKIHSEEEYLSHEAPESTEAVQDDSGASYQNKEKPYRTDS